MYFHLLVLYLEQILMENIDFDSLYQEVVRPYFEKITDIRRHNTLYRLADTLSSVFAMFSLKSSSLLDFEQRSEKESNNICAVYGISSIPSDSQVRNILDKVDSCHFGALFSQIYGYIKDKGIVSNYAVLSDYVAVSVDGTDFFSSQKVSCPKCLSKTHKNGKVTCHHSMLSAVLVHPDKQEVFPLGNEAIIKQDGETKNDCELNAVERLLETLHQAYAGENFLFLEDALYANSPHIALLNSYGYAYLIRAKAGNNQSLFQHFEQAKAQGSIQEKIIKTKQKEVHKFSYVNHLKLNKSTHTVCNFLAYEYTNNKAEKQTFYWISHLEITQDNVWQMAKVARARWKIENETFNTLKNQGYHLEHNYGHGKQYLAENFAILMFLAFLIDQIQQTTSNIFRKVWKGIGTKKKLWFLLRTTFIWVEVKSMQDVWIGIAQKYRLKLE